MSKLEENQYLILVCLILESEYSASYPGTWYLAFWLEVAASQNLGECQWRGSSGGQRT